MADQVVRSPRALEDVEEIALFIAKDSPPYAAAVVRKILDTTVNLDKFPDRGELYQSWGTQIFEKSWRTAIASSNAWKHQTLIIAAVIHGKRLLETEMNDS